MNTVISAIGRIFMPIGADRLVDRDAPVSVPYLRAFHPSGSLLFISHWAHGECSGTAMGSNPYCCPRIIREEVYPTCKIPRGG